jgi:hypothetical protein
MKINLKVLISNKLRYAYRSKYTGPSVEDIRKDMDIPPSIYPSHSIVILSSITNKHIKKNKSNMDKKYLKKRNNKKIIKSK